MSRPLSRRSDFKPPLKRPAADHSADNTSTIIVGKQSKLVQSAPSNSGNQETSKLDVSKVDIEVLRERNRKLDEEIAELRGQGFDESELKLFIDKLHKYNEIKDVAQLLLGQLAVREGVTTKSLYPKYGLNLDD